MPNSEFENLKGRYVQFFIRDIHLPEPAVVLWELHGGEILEGRVVDLSDSGGGAAGSVFVVIEVDGLRQPCILAVERILNAV